MDQLPGKLNRSRMPLLVSQLHTNLIWHNQLTGTGARLVAGRGSTHSTDHRLLYLYNKEHNVIDLYIPGHPLVLALRGWPWLAVTYTHSTDENDYNRKVMLLMLALRGLSLLRQFTIPTHIIVLVC